MNQIQYPKRLIEVDLPIKEISRHARREKSIRHGHISTLHIWWARRPLAACRAVICAALWPDPADPLCPEKFKEDAASIIAHFLNPLGNANLDYKEPLVLRDALLKFIADFANWDNSTDQRYLETSRALTQSAHESLGGAPGSRPLVVDPFAGGGAIPLEALRVGADAFASDLNPVAVLLNKVVLEYIPRYGQKLADEVRKWGEWIKVEAEKELAEFYPRDPDGSIPIAYLWARTITCEGPNCGAKIPLIGRSIIAKRKHKDIAISLERNFNSKSIKTSIVQGPDANRTKGSCKRFTATCPLCDFSMKSERVQGQLKEMHGGTEESTLLVVLTDGLKGRSYRLPNQNDFRAYEWAKLILERKIGIIKKGLGNLSPVPDEPIPKKTAHRAVGSQLPLYGFEVWGDLFNSRQKLQMITFQRITREVYAKLLQDNEEHFARAIYLLLAFAIDKQSDYSSSLCRWVSKGEFIAGVLAGEKKLKMIPDFAEANPIGTGSGSWANQIDWIARFIEREAKLASHDGIASQCSADEQILPTDSASAMITDPPYFDSVPYADLSDYFYVWLKRTFFNIDNITGDSLTPKEREITVNHPHNLDEKSRYQDLLTLAFSNGREITMPGGIGVIVFAHKSTSGWESLLEAIIKSGWIVMASWPIDTERTVRPNALETASLTSSIHIICRPRENPDGSIRERDVGDWRSVLQELPGRIHTWLPRLANEGVVGADAIFSCIGPALEIYSRYSRVEKASGEQVSLSEYLQEVWAAVSREALGTIFSGDTSSFEEDARLTAMWLWTLTAGANGNGNDKDYEVVEDEDTEAPSKSKLSGFILEFDAARKIAQGLCVRLENLSSLVEVKGDKARLLPVSERAPYLLGKEPMQAKKRKKDKTKQMTLAGGESTEMIMESPAIDESFSPGSTTLDRVHQAMLLFGEGRGDGLKNFLQEIGQDQGFWSLAQALNSLYPVGSEERRWVEGVLARKKSMGL